MQKRIRNINKNEHRLPRSDENRYGEQADKNGHNTRAERTKYRNAPATDSKHTDERHDNGSNDNNQAKNEANVNETAQHPIARIGTNKCKMRNSTLPR